MATFEFGTDHTLAGDPRFVNLGKDSASLNETDKENFLSKILHRTAEKPSGSWATLGWENDDEFMPRGKMAFSESGNLDSASTTLEEIKSIYAFNPLSKTQDFIVKERYINFDEVDFGFDLPKFTYDQIPRLRLTVFMDPDEGALVYYQHSKKSDIQDSEAEIEYILPEATDAVHSTTGRDRLHYFFPILTETLEEVESSPGYVCLNGKSRSSSFIIKVLTFKRNPLTASELVQEAFNQLNINAFLTNQLETRYGLSKYRLLKYNAASNDFDDSTANPIDYNARTLLLVHGTFASTKASYGGTYLPDFGEESFLLRSLIEQRVFDQIIAFDHPTITHDVYQNAQRLYEFLGANTFRHPLGLVGTSRGALLVKWLASDPGNRNFTVKKVLTFSGANGVGYYSFGKNVNLALKIWKKLAGPGTKALAVFAQFSVEFFLKLPGNRQMTPGSERLNKIIRALPVSPTTRFQAVAADWHHSLPSVLKFLPADVALDATIKLILGKQHDWVVGFEQQKISPSNYSEPPIETTSMHVKNLHLGYVKENTHRIIRNYFG